MIFRIIIPSDKHIFELHSNNDFNLYIDKIENLDNYSLLLIAKGDKNYFPETFNSFSNISDISETTINNFPISYYNFEYLDDNTNQNYYIQIIKVLLKLLILISQQQIGIRIKY